MCVIFSACSYDGDAQIHETTNAETNIVSEISSVTETDTVENETFTDTKMTDIVSESASVAETDTVKNETSVETEGTIDMTEDFVSQASRLMGALDYIDRIGGGSIPKDENDTVEVDGRQYAKVNAQFTNTADLKQFMEENLSETLIQNRYSHILGGKQPYYIDIDGELYGYVTAKGCGYPWITEDGKPVISITDVSDDSFTAVAKFDNYGNACEMNLDIFFTDGFWKIASVSYDGMTF